ncbi:hypothetical protein F383_31899 [Gossypium arboreum]|uniref:Uncharacterized protein n=1 Tax=Gossypium arboreum TaxID=29729 RepID=A0A0B0MDD2_GOSAR|nr:hypothetical protein F383_36864 [Gossypium arboreum]KHG15154.1 hypothetical protein F383_20079 [Gossypium arboreum]KHG17668.1 hypothetical protein F383_01921 [Gossypium arboreum]KHG25979.1 hypothetical protein F383_31899 [Gossypium arboreum]
MSFRVRPHVGRWHRFEIYV